MSRSLSYADAVRLLGGQNSKIVTALSRLTGDVLLGAVPGTAALLSWLDARAEFARLGNKLVRSLSERRSGLSRYDRTQRLQAAHTVIVVTAYFEALAGADLPLGSGDLALTRAEQVALAGGGPAVPGAALVEQLLSADALLPRPEQSHEDLLAALRDHYQLLSEAVSRFVQGLSTWERLTRTDRDRFTGKMKEVPARACARYEELFRQLAVDFPEVAWWAGLREHRATRHELRDLAAALADLEQVLAGISTGRAPDERRSALARAYRARLGRPIVEPGDVPAGLTIPALAEGYVTPLFRAAAATPGHRSNDEVWWRAQPVRDDLREFLTGHLTSPQATRAPLLVLGQPGSGKSVLTKMLAARLPAEDFLPVRVVLRDVPATADLQDQIEYAIRSATGERLDWPALARSAGDALPVVLLDGFDELLQATGVSQSDYLTRVAAFQQREADQGRPVAVVVTSRTSVAGRARPPADTVALRLEPFDEARIGAWLATWNAANAGYLAARGLPPLSTVTMLAHRQLAEQPLLLLMLALYDADSGALQRSTGELRQSELYERLLHRFATREVAKHHRGLSDRDREHAVENELRRLSVVAFAMFNRRAQWVTEPDLEADLPALFGAPPAAASPPGTHGMRAGLRQSEIVLGQFFFIHRAQASRDDARLQTYEFLHATFGEYLVARFTWQVLHDVAARDAASTMSMSAAPVDDDLLHALLSFTPLSTRSPTVDFLREMAAQLDTAGREELRDLLVRLLRVAHEPRPPRRFASYQPRRLPVPARHAAHSANLVLLVVCVTGSILVSELYGTQAHRPPDSWYSQNLLWRSQLSPTEFRSVVNALRLDRVWVGDRRDIRLALDDGTFQAPPVDLYWTYDLPPGDPARGRLVVDGSPRPGGMHRKGYFESSMHNDLREHLLEPLVEMLGPAVTMFVGTGPGGAYTSAARALLDAWLLPLRNAGPDERRAVYQRCARFAVLLDNETRRHYAALLVDRLAADEDAPPDLVAAIRSQVDPLLDTIGRVIEPLSGSEIWRR